MAAIVSLRQLIDAFDAAFNPSDLTNFYGNDWLDVRNAIELSVTGINTAEVQIGGTTRLTDAGGASLSECLPDTNLTRSLGTAGLQWKELFAQTIYGAGTGLTGVLLLSGGTMAGNISMAGNSITNLPAIPTDSTEAVPKSYVDAFAAGLKVKTQCRVATAVELIGTRATNTITADANGSINAAGIDGITTLAIGDSVLMKNQGDAAKSKTDQGIYQITDLGSAGTPWVMVRRADADSSADVMHGMYTFVVEGTANGNKGYYLTTDDPIVLNTTALDFTIYVGVEDITASSPLQRVGNDLQLTGVVAEANGGTNQSTYATGDVIYASASNTLSKLAAGSDGDVLQLASGIPSWSAIPSGVGASAYDSSGVSQGTGWAVVALDAEDYDPHGFHDPVTNNDRMTVPSGLGGRYLVNARLTYTANTTGIRGIRIDVNGVFTSSYFLSHALISVETPVTLIKTLNLSAGDYVQMYSYQTSGGALSLFAGTARSWLQLDRLGDV